MGKKIIFQRCQFNNIYFLLYIIMDFLNHLIEYKLSPSVNEINELKSKYLLPSQILILFYIGNISDFLAIIPYFIRKALLKKAEDNITNIKNEDNKNTHNSNLIYNNRIKIRRTNILMYVRISQKKNDIYMVTHNTSNNSNYIRKYYKTISII